MKMWTIQSKAVVDEIKRTGEYLPDFHKSHYYNEPSIHGSTTQGTYDFLLNAFNAVNKSNVSGVIFGFAKVGTDNPIKNYEEFITFMEDNNDVINTLYFINNADFKVLELQYEDTFNPLIIDYNDWQIIMPPPMHAFEQHIPNILNSLTNGEYHDPPIVPRISQLHAPYIKSENIIGVYDNVWLD